MKTVRVPYGSGKALSSTAKVVARLCKKAKKEGVTPSLCVKCGKEFYMIVEGGVSQGPKSFECEGCSTGGK